MLRCSWWYNKLSLYHQIYTKTKENRPIRKNYTFESLFEYYSYPRRKIGERKVKIHYYEWFSRIFKLENIYSFVVFKYEKNLNKNSFTKIKMSNQPDKIYINNGNRKVVLWYVILILQLFLGLPRLLSPGGAQFNNCFYSLYSGICTCSISIFFVLISSTSFYCLLSFLFLIFHFLSF